MNRAGFEWDPNKARLNLTLHRVSFEEAATVFADPNALHVPDMAHPDRFVTIGLSNVTRLLFVVYTERLEGDIVRIIHARKATPMQRKRYSNG
jgi:uncharacterized protein